MIIMYLPTFFKVNPILTPSMSGTAPPRSDYAINLHPDVTTLSKFGKNWTIVFTSFFPPILFKTNLMIIKNNSGSAFIDLVIKYGWVSVTILYENNESMMRLKEIYTHTSKVKITI